MVAVFLAVMRLAVIGAKGSRIKKRSVDPLPMPALLVQKGQMTVQNGIIIEPEFGGSDVDVKRKRISKATTRERKASLGQFLTPSPIARYMASLLPLDSAADIRLLDAGAGIGSLASAFLDRASSANQPIHVTAYEIDKNLIPYLHETLNSHVQNHQGISFDVVDRDFLEVASNEVSQNIGRRFSHAILNPPYKKISSNSKDRVFIRASGLETVNLYSGFVGISLLLMDRGGFVCAIIPRSFCNGPYYKPFRQLIAREGAIRHVHLFESRAKAFSDDDVLQENVIILIERGAEQGPVSMSSSADGSFDDLTNWTLPAEAVVKPDDDDLIIHLPTQQEAQGILPESFASTLEDIGVKASTGPVVDFRMKEHLRGMPESGCAPLLYPVHFANGELHWPKEGIKKPNAIAVNAMTERWLYPRGAYTVVRRFSSKEEKRRVVANVVRSEDFDSDLIGFENHLNVFHSQKRGMDVEVAHGLAVYLNSTIVDRYFRTFNGHTQVNATDLKKLPYPSLEALKEMGRRALPRGAMSQEEIDALVEGVA